VYKEKEALFFHTESPTLLNPSLNISFPALSTPVITPESASVSITTLSPTALLSILPLKVVFPEASHDIL